MPEPSPRRHDLAVVAPHAWRDLLATQPALAAEPLVAGWAERGWPLIVRRGTPCETGGVPLGLPLPPSHGKRRLAFVLPHAAILATTPPPPLRAAVDVAPPSWRPSMRRIDALAASLGGEVRLHGSLAWRHLTGLEYVTARSDLDVLLSLPRPGDVARLTTALAGIARTAPMGIDGELVRADGAGVSWRELHACPREVLMKTRDAAVIVDTARFLAGTPS